jgi:hypothetical protein
MPSLTVQELKLFAPRQARIFVETGTYKGDTIQAALNRFASIYSIELCPHLASEAATRFKSQKHVSILKGDSSVVLRGICPLINRPAFFWLDGHWSGKGTARGGKDCPLLEELECISLLCAPSCTIAIDDARLFGTNLCEDWRLITKETVIKAVGSRMRSWRFYASTLHEHDRMIISLRSNTPDRGIKRFLRALQKKPALP